MARCRRPAWRAGAARQNPPDTAQNSNQPEPAAKPEKKPSLFRRLLNVFK